MRAADMDAGAGVVAEEFGSFGKGRMFASSLSPRSRSWSAYEERCSAAEGLYEAGPLCELRAEVGAQERLGVERAGRIPHRDAEPIGVEPERR